MKIKVGKNQKFGALQFESMRKASQNMTMMADSNHAYDLSEAIRIGRVLEESDFSWFEEPLLSIDGLQIARPDLAYCGGPSKALEMRNLASSIGINVVPHCWGTVLNLPAATHFLASRYRELGRKEVTSQLLEHDRTPNAQRDQLLAYQ